MKKHVAAVHCERKFQCDICNQSFKINANLRLHKKAVHEKANFWKCDTCELEFASKSSLTQHTKTVHQKIRNFHCEICDKWFTQKPHLRKHKLVMHRSTEESLKCELADWPGFARPSARS